jgi:hypothetical protein
MASNITVGFDQRARYVCAPCRPPRPLTGPAEHRRAAYSELLAVVVIWGLNFTV